jgi:NADPH:quinone reductase
VPHIGATFDLTDAAAAMRHVADGKAIGKVVLDVTIAPGVVAEVRNPR